MKILTPTLKNTIFSNININTFTKNLSNDFYKNFWQIMKNSYIDNS
jgi:hypothetical protein